MLLVNAGGLGCRDREQTRRTGAGREFGKTEIQYLGVAALGDEKIRGFDIAMDDAFAVSRVESVCDLDGQRHERFVLERTPCNAMLERHAIEKLHGDESLASFVPDVVNGANIGMIQSGRGLSFPLKAGQSLRITGNFCGQEFESDKAMQPRVFRFVHDTHAAATKFLEDEVVRDGFADHGLEIIGKKRAVAGPFHLTDAASARQRMRRVG